MATEKHTLLRLDDASALTLRARALVFEDPASQELLEEISRIAPSMASVLLVGETGTGKEIVARHIHALSGRKGPFVAVNCAALSPTLVESELFGHEKGSFTGAVKSRAGYFLEAAGGTLFLDEVGDLPLSLQVKLLRVLQEKEVTPVGKSRPIAVDVRVVAATNIDLEEAVAAGSFRMDLYFRLGVAALRLLPLRERKRDILPLAEYFSGVYGQKLGLKEVVLTAEAKQKLLQYPYPGNIRELENIIHYALLVARDGVILAENLKLPRFPRFHEHGAPGEKDLASRLKEDFLALIASGEEAVFDQAEGLLLAAAMEHTGHNQVQAARVLGISRNVLRARLLRHGLLKAAKVL